MLLVTINKRQYEYDIHSLVKAFYPEEEVKVILKEESSCFVYRDLFLDIEFEDEEQKTEYNHLLCVRSYQGDKSFEIAIEPHTDRTQYRNILKQAMYHILSEISGQVLPWGTLTGIRPTKIPMTLLEEGNSKEEVFHFMKDTYLLNDEKAKLSIEIADRELQILSAVNYQNGYSIYIGIPFCPTTCLYCSFTSYPIGVWKTKVEDYLDALEKEIDFVANSMKTQTLTSVYIGGGTPTTLNEIQLERLLKKLTTSFDFESVKEFTVEAGRADSITKEKLKIMKQYGVERISVNPQTMKEETLRIIGRGHRRLPRRR